MDSKPNQIAVKASYPQIHKLGLKIYNEPISHVLSEDLDKVLSKNDRKKFSDYFGVQTCLLLDNGAQGLYVWDVEAVLERMFSARRTGTQLIWD